VKRISAKARPLFSYHNLFILALLVTMTSCSWISSRRSLFGDDDKKEKAQEAVETVRAQEASTQTVSKAQYELLLKKYEALSGDTTPTISSADSLRDQGFDDPSDLVAQLNNVSTRPELAETNVSSRPELAETVDVFGRSGMPDAMSPRKAPPPMLPVSINKPKKYSSQEIEFQIQQLKKAQALMAQNKFDATLKIVKKLENSSIKQVRVRAKFIFGELLFAQQEYDLAMQVFEEIIRKEAFSGMVIKALGRLVVCSEKLKLNKKKEQYYSLLNDILGSV
jgi:tetratricopeptide (TPR) repeat protein